MFLDHLLDVLVDRGVRPHMFVLAIADGKVLFVNDVGIQAPLVGELLVAKGGHLLNEDGDNLLRRVEVDEAGRAGLLGLEREHSGSLVRRLTWCMDSRGLPVSSS